VAGHRYPGSAGLSFAVFYWQVLHRQALHRDVLHRHILHRPVLQFELKRPDIYLFYFVDPFGDLDELPGSDIGKGLYDTGRRPFYFQLIDFYRLTDANLLSQRRGPKAAAGVDIPVNGSPDAVLRKADGYLGADGRTVGMNADQFYSEPIIIILAWVKIEGIIKGSL
jgi:hypothetical protein